MAIENRYLILETRAARRRAIRRASVRYDVLNRLSDSCRRHQVALLAFGFDDRGLRLVLEGPPAQIEGAERGWRLSVGRSYPDLSLLPYRALAVLRRALEHSVTWAHEGPLDAEPEVRSALASAWSSHRDVLGYRRAPFFDPRPLLGHLPPASPALARIVSACGGVGPVRACTRQEGLLYLSQVAASVIGREASDPETFPLFSQLARGRRWRVKDIAAALLVGPRRIRQLCVQPHPALPLAELALEHPDTLGRVPDASLQAARPHVDRDRGVGRDLVSAA